MAGHDLGVVCVVFDNGAFDNVKADQRRIYSREAGADLRDPGFVALARSFGADGYRATNPVQLRQVPHTALDRDRPSVIAIPMPLTDSSLWPFLMPTPRQ